MSFILLESVAPSTPGPVKVQESKSMIVGQNLHPARSPELRQSRPKRNRVGERKGETLDPNILKSCETEKKMRGSKVSPDQEKASGFSESCDCAYDTGADVFCYTQPCHGKCSRIDFQLRVPSGYHHGGHRGEQHGDMDQQPGSLPHGHF